MIEAKAQESTRRRKRSPRRGSSGLARLESLEPRALMSADTGFMPISGFDLPPAIVESHLQRLQTLWLDGEKVFEVSEIPELLHDGEPPPGNPAIDPDELDFVMIGGDSENPPTTVNPDSLLEIDPATLEGHVNIPTLPPAGMLRIEGRLGFGDQVDVFRLPLGPDAEILEMEFWRRGPQPDGKAFPPGFDGDPDRLGDFRVSLRREDGQELGCWIVSSKRAIWIHVRYLAEDAGHPLLLVVERNCNPTNASRSEATTAEQLEYGFQIARSSVGSALPAEGPDSDGESFGTPPQGSGQPIALVPQSADVAFMESYNRGRGSMTLPPVVGSIGRGRDLSGLALNSTGGRSTPTQAAGPVGGILGSSVPVVDNQMGQEADAESEPLLERLLHHANPKDRPASSETMAAAELEESWTLDPTLDAKPAEGLETGTTEFVDLALEEVHGPLLGARLWYRPRRRDDLASTPPAEETMVVSEPPPNSDELKVLATTGFAIVHEDREEPASLQAPMARAAVVTTAALLAGLWLPDLNPRKRIPALRRPHRTPQRRLEWLSSAILNLRPSRIRKRATV